MDDLDISARVARLRALLEQLDALSVDTSIIRRKLDANRLTPALARSWLASVRAQLRQIDDLVGSIGDQLQTSDAI